MTSRGSFVIRVLVLTGAALCGLSGVASAATITSLTDDFTADTIDASKWAVGPFDWPNESGNGSYTSDTTTNSDQLTISGTSGPANFWGGQQLESVDSFSAGLETSISVDRVSMAGTGSGNRTGLMLMHDDGQFLLFAQSTETGNNWHHVVDSGGGGANSGVGAAGNDLGLHTAKIVVTPTGGNTATATLFLDATEGVTVNLNNWDNAKDFKARIITSARANGDTVTGVFDNFNAQAVPEPGAGFLLSISMLALAVFRSRRRP